MDDEVTDAILRSGLTAEQITNPADTTSGNAALLIAVDTLAGAPKAPAGVSPALIIGGLAALGAVAFLVLRRKR